MTDTEPVPGVVTRAYIAQQLKMTLGTVANLQVKDAAFPPRLHPQSRAAYYWKADADRYIAIRQGRTPPRRPRKSPGPAPVEYGYFAQQLGVTLQTVWGYAHNPRSRPRFPTPVNPAARYPLWHKDEADRYIALRRASIGLRNRPPATPSIE